MGNTWFPFAGYWWLYLAFTGLVVVLFATDLAYRRKDRAISIRGAAASTVRGTDDITIGLRDRAHTWMVRPPSRGVKVPRERWNRAAPLPGRKPGSAA